MNEKKRRKKLGHAPRTCFFSLFPLKEHNFSPHVLLSRKNAICDTSHFLLRSLSFYVLADDVTSSALGVLRQSEMLSLSPIPHVFEYSDSLSPSADRNASIITKNRQFLDSDVTDSSFLTSQILSGPQLILRDATKPTRPKTSSIHASRRISS